MKRIRIDVSNFIEELITADVQLEKKKITAENLDLDYIKLFSKGLASQIMHQLEESVEYLSEDLSKVKVFGKWHSIPRQQAAYGDNGTVYRFSNNSIPCKPWIEPLVSIKNLLKHLTGFDYNFVLINRYRNGTDHIGEHKDNESELDKDTPIASLSLGQQRLFVLKHQDVKKKGKQKRNIANVKLELQHGSLLLMNPPTNRYWYHSLPSQKNAPGVRINMTFRKINSNK